MLGVLTLDELLWFVIVLNLVALCYNVNIHNSTWTNMTPPQPVYLYVCVLIGRLNLVSSTL